MTVGKLSPNLAGFALFHRKIVNEALKWRWISECNLTLTLRGPALAAHSSRESCSALQLLAAWEFFTSRQRARAVILLTPAVPHGGRAPPAPSADSPSSSRILPGLFSALPGQRVLSARRFESLAKAWECPRRSSGSLPSPSAPQNRPLSPVCGGRLGSILLRAGPHCLMRFFATCLPLTNAFWSSLPDSSTSAGSLHRSAMKGGFVKPPQAKLSCGWLGSSRQPAGTAGATKPRPSVEGGAGQR